ncbi:MAG TPA: PhzF family phenazine biosynthesis protein [Bacteroidales bacterium]|nr:PhzF family phenazine biosynthesis protein [Bacteroidales bacterium]
MKTILYQVDAFTDQLFQGNPAAVLLLDEWFSDTTLQKIAAENNLSETAFVKKAGEGFEIRWFTPRVEVELCGHATLASAHVLFQHQQYPKEEISFASLSGKLTVRKDKDLLVLNFPAGHFRKIEVPFNLSRSVMALPVETYQGKTDVMMVFEKEEQIVKMKPDFTLMSSTPARGVIVTAPGKSSDFVSRFFAPQVGINEDPVTGSAHTMLIPYWSQKLGKKEMKAIQLSERKGFLLCRDLGERVEIGGKAVTYLVGEIDIKEP